MEVTKEKVVESINTYCAERKYGSETLTESFKEKFSNSFVKKYAEKDVEESDVIADLHFNLDSAFNAGVVVKTTYTEQFTTKENEYKKQIEELNKKLGNKTNPNSEPPKFELPKELQEQLDELKRFKNEEAKKAKRKSILKIAKEGIRQDYHASFDEFAKDIDVLLDKDEKEQADAMVAKFQAISKGMIGDIKPFAPRQTQKRDEDFLSSLPKIKVI